jgi:phosphoglycolate phosphatase-like HAD superfamily hydrolase
VTTLVVLFDLDGTVLTFDGAPPGPGRTALERAMQELYGLARATDGLRVAGGTDRGLARALLGRAGAIADDAAIDRVIRSYLRHLAEGTIERHYRPVGDVAGAVTRLRERGAVVGIATGNVREGARIKLGSAGLHETFDLALGGFGDDAEARADIVRIGAQRCAASRPARLVVVGDTERDVHAGRAVGARVVGVASNDTARKELAAAGADAIADACDEALVDAIFA